MSRKIGVPYHGTWPPTGSGLLHCGKPGAGGLAVQRFSLYSFSPIRLDIEVFYNRQRRHSTLGYLSLAIYEHQQNG